MLLSTLSPDCDSQSDSSVVSRQMQSVRKRNARVSSRGVNRSSNRKKPVKTEVNDMFKNRPTEERNWSDETLNQNKNTSMNIISAKAYNSANDVREKNLHIPEQNHHSVASSPASTSSATNRKTSEDQRKLVKSVFSSITKRKSTNDEEDLNDKREGVAVECVDLEENIPRSPPQRQVAKKARLIFQKCFQNTFDPRMLPGHDTILVEDSDENNSD